jgi:GTP-binding protein EngB required for normal cell division
MQHRNDPSVNSALEETTQRLADEVRQSLSDLTQLELHGEQLGKATVDRIASIVAELKSRLNRREVYVCVVGEQKAGKSTLLNAILGIELLGTAVRECTGTVGYLRRGDRLGYRARLQTGAWEDFESIFPNQEDAYIAAADHQQVQIELCDSKALIHPVEVQRLEQSLREMQETLASRIRKRDATEARASTEQSDYQRRHAEVAAFANELRAVEHSVPWRYRRANGWNAICHQLARVVQKRWEQPAWREHLIRVAECEDLRRRLGQQERIAKSEADLAESLRRAVNEQQQAIDDTTKSLQALKQELTDLPSIRAEWLERSTHTQEAWRQHREQRLSRFIQEVKLLTDMNRRGHEVEELDLTVPTDRLPDGVVLIDTPGVNTANEENRERAWRAVQSQADACILVSDISQTLSESTREFVRQVRQVTPHILLVLTKVDAAITSAESSGGDAEQEIAEAVQVGRTRFAEEVGRPEHEILTFAVAARPALKQAEGPAVEAFNAELQRLFQVVDAERSIAVTAKCARAIRNAHRATEQQIEHAEQEYGKRIETLMQQQLRDPVAWCKDGVTALIPEIQTLGRDISAMLRSELHTPLAALRASMHEQLSNATDSQKLADAVGQFHDAMPGKLDEIARQCREKVDASYAGSLNQLIEKARQPLHERYRISQATSRTAAAPPRVQFQPIAPTAKVSLSTVGAELQEKVKNYAKRNQSLAIGLGKVGGQYLAKPNSTSLAVVAVGLAIGAAMGAMHARKFQKLKTECVAKIDEILEQMIDTSTSEAMIGARAMEFSIGAQLNAIVYQDAVAFQGWIQNVIRSEQQALAGEQQKLNHLRAIRGRLSEHDGRLRTLLQEASKLCTGLSRSGEAPQDESQQQSVA